MRDELADWSGSRVELSRRLFESEQENSRFPSPPVEETTLKFRPALICCAALVFACSIQEEASAGRHSRANRSETATTILPSPAEISAVPVPERGRVLAYPVDVVRYGLTIHPGARIVRRMTGR